ncbi:hypothetical protein KAI60_04800, partial [Candidatus Bathyarchaeota archaeon]|nr:hypothetical protein [Candidatus Bathyarchaeota archaeon]
MSEHWVNKFYSQVKGDLMDWFLKRDLDWKNLFWKKPHAITSYLRNKSALFNSISLVSNRLHSTR